MQYLVKILGFALLFTITAQAVTDFNNAPSGAHYASGSAEPVCTLSGSTVRCTSTNIQGVGNNDATVLLIVEATFTGVCHNPGNENVIDQFTETASDSSEATVTPSKNGRLVVPAQTATVITAEEFLETFECPNPNWTAELTDSGVTFTYTLTFEGFEQPAITITGSG